MLIGLSIVAVGEFLLLVVISGHKYRVEKDRLAFLSKLVAVVNSHRGMRNSYAAGARHTLLLYIRSLYGIEKAEALSAYISCIAAGHAFPSDLPFLEDEKAVRSVILKRSDALWKTIAETSSVSQTSAATAEMLAFAVGIMPPSDFGRRELTAQEHSALCSHFGPRSGGPRVPHPNAN